MVVAPKWGVHPWGAHLLRTPSWTCRLPACPRPGSPGYLTLRRTVTVAAAPAGTACLGVSASPLGRAPQPLSHLLDRQIRSALHLHDPVGDGVAGETCDVVDSEGIHQVLAVLLHRLDAYPQDDRDLLVRLALGNQLQDLPLAPGHRLGLLRELLAIGKRSAAKLMVPFCD